MKTRNGFLHTVLCLAASWVLAAGLLGSGARAATVNVESMYGKWPQGIVPYCIDNVYTPAEMATINTALQAIRAEAPFIQFVALPSCSDTRYKIRMTSVIPGTTSPQPYSWSYPGMNLSLVNQGAKEQVVSIVRDPQAGLPLRQVMKMLVTVLGLRNEHQRVDRDTYLVMHPENISLASAYTKYTPAQAYSATEFDYCSITLNTPSDYAKTGTKAFDLAKTPVDNGFSMWRPELSRMDVDTLSSLYNAGFKSTKQCCLALLSCQQSLKNVGPSGQGG